MKKVIVALCALAMLGLVACHKDEEATQQPGGETPVTPTPTPTPTPPATNQEGVYNPGAHIVTISVNDTAREQWSWTDGRLVSVTDGTSSSEKMHYTYDDNGRISSITLNATGAMSGDLGVTYSGDYISSMNMVSGGTQLVAMQVSHNSANKVSSALLTLEDNLLLDIFNSVISQFTGGGDGDDFVTGIDSTSASVAFSWNGDNVRTAIINVKARLATTLGQIGSLIDDFSIFGSYGSTLQALVTYMPDKPVYLRVAMADTVAYTYDDHVNPFRHNLGRLIPSDMSISVDVSALSANNATSEMHSAGATLDVLIALMGSTPTQVYNTDYPLDVRNNNYRYDYNDAGYPVSVTDQEANVKTYTYQQ